jgi:hypothetical protein
VDFLEGSGGGDKVVVFYYIGNLEETGVKPNLEKKIIYSNKFFHNFHLPRASSEWVSTKTVISASFYQTVK